MHDANNNPWAGVVLWVVCFAAIALGGVCFILSFLADAEGAGTASWFFFDASWKTGCLAALIDIRGRLSRPLAHGG